MGISKAMYSQGYCLTKGCKDYNQGTFLSGIEPTYICHRCNEVGRVKFEKHWPTRYDSLEFNQVRLEFAYWAPDDTFKNLFVVTDENRDKACNVWNIQTPNVKTEKIANKIATDALGFLQRGDRSIFEPNIIIRNSEIILDFDVPWPRLREDLDRLASTLGGSRLCVEHKKT